MNQHDKAVRFRELHQQAGAFVFPNPWDGGSARLLEAEGFVALATSSAAHAATLGKRDGGVSRDEALAHARLLVDAVAIPVAADLENGFGATPEIVAETIQLAAATGLVGGSIEDATGNATTPLYPVDEATDRIAAAVKAARSLSFPFTLTARAENFIRGKPDLEDTIRRLQAYERAGADVLFAPGLPDLAAIRKICAAVSKPVNVMASVTGKGFTVADLANAGVKRISLAASLYRAAMTGLLDAAKEVRDRGTFGYVERTLTTAQMNASLRA
jgi:2-methylisocitrate lyase-like PEP mutase family enzyme